MDILLWELISPVQCHQKNGKDLRQPWLSGLQEKFWLRENNSEASCSNRSVTQDYFQECTARHTCNGVCDVFLKVLLSVSVMV